MANAHQRIGGRVRGVGAVIVGVAAGVAGAVGVVGVVALGVVGVGGCQSSKEQSSNQRGEEALDARYARCVELVKKYAHEVDSAERTRLLTEIGRTRTALAVMVLAHGLRDEDPPVLKAAVDGMVDQVMAPAGEKTPGVGVGVGASREERLAAARAYWEKHEKEWEAKATAESERYRAAEAAKSREGPRAHQ